MPVTYVHATHIRHNYILLCQLAATSVLYQLCHFLRKCWQILGNEKFSWDKQLMVGWEGGCDSYLGYTNFINHRRRRRISETDKTFMQTRVRHLSHRKQYAQYVIVMQRSFRRYQRFDQRTLEWFQQIRPEESTRVQAKPFV